MTSFALLRIHKDIDASRFADLAQAVDKLVTPHGWMIGYAHLNHKDNAPVPGCNSSLRVFSYGGRFSADRFSCAPIV